jgi:hypothetical protein
VLKMTGFSCKIILLLLAFVFCSTALLAEPAYWFQWESKFNGKMICKQISPGEGWQQHAGPFYDAQCRKAVPKYQSALNR